MARAAVLSVQRPTDRLVEDTPAIQALRAQIRHLAAFDAVGNPAAPTVLLQGETGTGKGLVARIIHDSGPRAPGPFLDVNCAAIPETLLEAELFGFEAGAFTDAKRAKPGLFEAASGGTLFLDEIEALPPALQPKLLTAIEAKHIRRLGAVVEHPVDTKLIAATQTDLRAAVSAWRFQADLYHRLAVVVLTLPPIRARGDDILGLARHFLQYYGAVHGLRPKEVSREAEAWLLRYDWPGNVRELSHLLERVTLLSPEPRVTSESLEWLCPPPLGAPLEPESAPTEGEADPWTSPAASDRPWCRRRATSCARHACWASAAGPCAIACGAMGLMSPAVRKSPTSSVLTVRQGIPVHARGRGGRPDWPTFQPHNRTRRRPHPPAEPSRAWPRIGLGSR
jgi:two-component system, NtrC family, response regulator AtoC